MNSLIRVGYTGNFRPLMQMAAARVVASGQYILGSEVEAFEEAWARSCGTDHAVGTANGLDAIEVSLRAVGIGPGDEVITTGMTAFATILGVIRAGATPVIADIDAGSALMSMDSAERCLTSRTRAILLVHLYGQMRDMDSWRDFSTRHGLLLLEDCAQAHLAQWEGRPAGSIGVAGAYSFYPTKNLGAMGDAGALVTSDSELADVARSLRDYGQVGKYQHDLEGLNSRLDEIQAAFLSERLLTLQGETDRRRAIGFRYIKEISNPLVSTLDPPQTPSAHVFHLFVIRCEKREEIRRHFASYGIETLLHYPIPGHKQRALEQFGADPLGLRNTSKHAETCLSIPCHPGLSDAEVDRVIECLAVFRGD
mgnify:CR=1 FL=1